MNQKLPKIICFLSFFITFSSFAQTGVGVSKITKSTFLDIVSKNEVQILDVRTSSEFMAGHIPNALNISISDDNFTTKISSLNKEQITIVYCSGGARSSRAAKILIQNGFSKVFDLIGGYTSYKMD